MRLLFISDSGSECQVSDEFAAGITIGQVREVARARTFRQRAFSESVQFVRIKMCGVVRVLTIAALLASGAQSFIVAPCVTMQQTIHLCVVRTFHSRLKVAS